VAGLLVCNQYGSLTGLTPYYRINTPALCLLFGFITACVNIRLAIMGCVFALPLLPTFARQFQQYVGYGRIQDVAGAGLDIVAGMLLGLIVSSLWLRKRISARLTMPWAAGVVMVIITISTVVALSRNLHQSASPFNLQALLYNLLHLRTLGWHDDYRPLLDWATYGSAFLLVAIFVPALKAAPFRNDLIFKPLIAGLVIAALVGWRQSAFGAGLNYSQLRFRVDNFGYMALGFQPDLHAFGAHMLLGALGLVGYLYYKKSPWLRASLIGLVIPLCWYVMFLSKSKATFAFAVCCAALFALLWFSRHSKYLKQIVIGVFLCLGGLVLSLFLFTDAWVAGFRLAFQALNLPDLFAINLKLSYRPEVYLAAIRMAMLFPFAGLGQAEFFRQSANHDLTNSYFLSIQQNGENAHNYFLQTLVENGLLGFAAFVCLIAYPIIKTANKRMLIPALVALVAMMGGNLFSHSMLVRENLLLAFCFVALLYAWAEAEAGRAQTQPGSTSSLGANNLNASLINRLGLWLSQPQVLLGCVIVAGLLIAKETYQSLAGKVFSVDVQCQQTRKLERDGWTAGRYVLDMPVGAQGVSLNLATTQPDVAQRPLPASLTIWFDRRLLLQQDLVLNKTGPQTIEINLPDNVLATPDDYQIELQVQRCFVPRNFGMGADARRLGVRIDSVVWK
jgi:O-antigen ligase